MTHLASIPDDELLRRLAELLRQSRRVEADLVAHIGEVERRRLYAREAVPSMFAYCTERLHLSEAEAYLRIGAARASKEHPMLLEMLRDGRLHLTAIGKLAPHLTPDNREALLKRAAHRSKRQLEELVAELLPGPDVPALMRKLPVRVSSEPTLELRPDAVAPSAARLHSDSQTASAPVLAPAVSAIELRPDGVEASVEPLAPGRYKVQFTASAALHDKLERLRALMRASVPDGDLAAIIEQAVGEKLDRLEARRFAKAKRPSQTVPRTRDHGTSRPRSGERSTLVTRAAAATWTNRVADARHAISSSSTITIPLLSAATVGPRTFGFCAAATTSTLPKPTSARGRSPGIAALRTASRKPRPSTRSDFSLPAARSREPRSREFQLGGVSARTPTEQTRARTSS